MFRDLLIYIRAFFRRRPVETQLDDKLRFHFDQHVLKFIQSGLPVKEARRRARLMFGGNGDRKDD
jgi:hypothetical protein